MLVCTSVGAVLVLIQAAHPIFFTLKNDVLYLDIKDEVETRFHGLHSRLLKMVYWSPLPLLRLFPLLYKSRRLSAISYSIPLDQNEFITLSKFAILPIHVFLIIGMTYYTLITYQ